MLSPASIRYLLAVYELSDGGAVRSVDIANALKVSRASVVKCLKRLAGEGMIRKEHYGAVQLTPEGVRESNRIFTEYTLLYAFFLQRLGVPPGCARRDAVSRSAPSPRKAGEQLIRRVLEPSFAEES